MKRPFVGTRATGEDATAPPRGATTYVKKTAQMSLGPPPPLPLRQHQPQPSDDFVGLDKDHEWDVFMQSIAEDEREGNETRSVCLQEDELLPSCPYAIDFDDGQAIDEQGDERGEDDTEGDAGEESEAPALGADISESSWLADDDEDDGLWGLPPVVADILGQRGITQFYGTFPFHILLILLINSKKKKKKREKKR